MENELDGSITTESAPMTLAGHCVYTAEYFPMQCLFKYLKAKGMLMCNSFSNGLEIIKC